MTYTFERSQVVSDDITMGDTTIHVEFDPQKIAIEFNKRRNALAFAEIDARREATQETMDELGHRMCALFEIIFGEENTVKILEYYEHNYVEMLTKIYPYIRDVAMPKIDSTLVELRTEGSIKYQRPEANRWGPFRGGKGKTKKKR